MRRAFAVVVALLIWAPLFAEESGVESRRHWVVSTNLAYLTLSAISTKPTNTFLVLPLESQISLCPRLSVNPALTFLYYHNVADLAPGAMLLGECGIGFHPGLRGLQGWSIALAPGFAYSIDSHLVGIVVSAEAGFQWILGRGLFLGLLGGGRFVHMDGTLVMPDLKFRLGWAQ